MITKDTILSEIRRVAQERGGRVGLKVFLKATDIPEKQILGKYWGTWNEALADAGVGTTSFARPRTPENSVLEAFVQLVALLQKWPTENELSLARRRDSSFPSLKVIRRLRAEGTFPVKVAAHCVDRQDLGRVAEIAAVQIARESATDTPPERAVIHGYVYMMRTGRRYKIGRSNSPARRHREVRLDLPDPTSLVHSIGTDDPSGIEAYWHRRFDSKRIRDTEFFNLDAADVAAFKRRKYQ